MGVRGAGAEPGDFSLRVTKLCVDGLLGGPPRGLPHWLILRVTQGPPASAVRTEGDGGGGSPARAQNRVDAQDASLQLAPGEEGVSLQPGQFHPSSSPA